MVTCATHISLAPAERYPIEGHCSISTLTLHEIIQLSHENIVRSVRDNEEGMIQKYFEIFHHVIENIHEASMEHSDEGVRKDFIDYRLLLSKQLALHKLMDYIISKQIDKVLRRACIGPKMVIVRESLENSIKPLIWSIIEKILLRLSME